MVTLSAAGAGANPRPPAPLAGHIRPPLPRLAELPPPATIPLHQPRPEADRKPGPMWGDFWPDEFVPEWDDVCFEPRDLTAKRGRFLIYSTRGTVLGERAERAKAMMALRHWVDAAYVTIDGTVIARRMESPVRAGETADDARTTTTEGGAE